MKRALSYIFIILLFISCSDESDECTMLEEIENSECIAVDTLNLCRGVECIFEGGSIILEDSVDDCVAIDCSSFQCNTVFFSISDQVIEAPGTFTDVFINEIGNVSGFIEVDGGLQEFECEQFD